MNAKILNNDILRKAAKRAFDVTAASIGLVVSFPVLAVTAVSLKVSLGGNIIFRQERIGLHGKPFIIYKLKTMRDAPDGPTKPFCMLAVKDRLTPTSRFCRRYHLDELPQLFNILRGDMSIVGPRPVPQIIDNSGKIYSLKPGLTGLSQIQHGNSCSVEQRLETDHRYVKNWSFWGDVHIILRTPKAILAGHKYAEADSNEYQSLRF